MTCCLPGHHWLLPQRNRRHGKHLLRPTQSTLIGVSSGWVGLRLLACLLPHPCLFSPAPIPAAPIPPGPVPAAPIPVAPIPAAGAPPVKPALRRSTRLNKGVNPNAVPIPVGPVPAAPIPAASIPAADAPPVRAKPALRRSTRVNKGVNPNAANIPRRAVWRP